MRRNTTQNTDDCIKYVLVNRC